ncbi:MAG: hypothetical protein NZ700_06960 [Gemmataceae bacterium]|nr:hypothetical protein [Gemmataceae bacterium]MDW8265029.1 hypothetical protein [Gemmataceae bacterium]
MPMPPYPVLCTTPACGRPAVYKVAARWSDGITSELKTYALSCPDCLSAWFHHSRHEQARCRRAPGEILEPPGIYLLIRGERDRGLPRLEDLERELLSDRP